MLNVKYEAFQDMNKIYVNLAIETRIYIQENEFELNQKMAYQLLKQVQIEIDELLTQLQLPNTNND